MPTQKNINEINESLTEGNSLRAVGQLENLDPAIRHEDLSDVVNLAVKRGYIDFLEALVEKRGVDVLNKVDKDGNTLLHKAVELGNLKSAKFLIEKNPRLLSAKNNKLETPVHCALNVYEEFLYGKDSFVGDERKDDALQSDYLAPELNVAEYLISSSTKEDLMAQDNKGNTVLHYAVKVGDTKLAESIVDGDSSILKMQNSEGKTPLHLVVERYIKPSTHSEHGVSFDELTGASDEVKVFSDIVDKRRKTMGFMRRKFEGIIRFFIGHKDNPLNVLDNEGKTALDYLKDGGLEHDSIYGELHKAGARTSSELKGPLQRLFEKMSPKDKGSVVRAAESLRAHVTQDSSRGGSKDHEPGSGHQR